MIILAILAEFDESRNLGEEGEDEIKVPDEDEDSFDEEDFLRSDESDVDITKMTARQRAAHVGNEPEILMTLPEGR